MTLILTIMVIWALLLAAFAALGWVSKSAEHEHISGRKLQSDKQMQGDLNDD